MIKIKKKPTYSKRFFNGKWKGIAFTLIDTNNEVFVHFSQHHELETAERIKLINKIVKKYKKEIK